MNDTIKQLYDRKSVRVFEDREITKEDKNTILEAATMAPTAGNQQLYTILDITDQRLKDKLTITCDNQPFIAKSKMVLIFCADCQKWYDGFKAAGCNPRKPGVGDFILAINDATIAAQNAVVAAQSLGIGSCYIGDIMENCEIHREILHLPTYVFPAVMLVFGYPTKQQIERKKPERAQMKYIVHDNVYHDLDNQDLEAMFDQRSGERSYEEYMQAFCERKYNSDFAKEMTRSVYEYIKEYITR